MSWDGKGSTRAWRRTRARILLRDGYVCQIRLEGCTGRATQVHHTVGRGVSESDACLEAACQSCNLALGNPQDHRDPAPVTRTVWGNA